jgi:hypothetical protein
LASRSKLEVERAPFWGILRFIALLCSLTRTLPLRCRGWLGGWAATTADSLPGGRRAARIGARSARGGGRAAAAGGRPGSDLGVVTHRRRHQHDG